MLSATIDPSVLDAIVEGRHLRPGTLRDQIGSRPTLLVMLRHLGCLFSSEWLTELRRAGSSNPSFPSVLYFHLGNTEQGDDFFSALAPDARAVADPKQFFYKALGVPKASKAQLLDPRVWACGFRASRNGHKAARPVGDLFMMPSGVKSFLFVFKGGGAGDDRAVFAFAHWSRS